jgi:catechol 2,3-dioxygenase
LRCVKDCPELEGNQDVSYLVHGLGFMSFDVRDLDGAVTDYTEVMGLHVVERTPQRAVLTSNERQAELLLHRAERTGVRAIGLEAYDAAAVEEVMRRAPAQGMKVVAHTPSIDSCERAVTIATEDGLLIEVHTPVPEDRSRRYLTQGVRPRRIDHIGPRTTDAERLSQQLQAVLGMKISDKTRNGELIFMRAGNQRHHTLSIVQGQTGMHHYAWEMFSFNDYMQIGDQLAIADLKYTYGPGRHGPGDNLFTYHTDRNGLMVECTVEMEMISRDSAQCKVWDLANPRLINQWGVDPHPGWLEHCTSFVSIH